MENEFINEELPLGAKIKYFFIRPWKAFEKYKEKPGYGILFAIIAVVTFVIQFAQYLLSRDKINDIMNKSLQNVQGQPGVQAMANIFTSPAFYFITILFASGFVLVGIWIISLIYWAVIRIFRGTITYKQTVSVYALSYMAVLAGSIFKFIYFLITGNQGNVVNSNYSDVIINSLNIFHIWQMVLLVFGISTVASISRKKGIIIVLILFILGVLLSMASFGFTQSVKSIAPTA